MLNLQGKGVMTTFWLLGEEGSEEGKTLKEEEEEEEEKVEVYEVDEVEEEEEKEACALVTYTVSDHDTERLMLNGDQNGFEGTEEENLVEVGKLASSTKETSLKEATTSDEKIENSLKDKS